MARIAVLDYGSGNLHSVSRAIGRVGGDAFIADDPLAVSASDALVIPGVGHFGACVREIRRRGLDTAIRSFEASGRPVFGVCVGMQILFGGSEEDPEPGLGILPGRSGRLPDAVKVPHMGWNTVAWMTPHPFTAGIPGQTRFYFVHSYAPEVEPSITIGVCEYGRAFGAVVARANVFATQFHPEKSGEAGLQVYEHFVKAAQAA
jgi:glutamine amidotransferase